MYELDYGRWYENGHHRIIAILTGLTIQEIVSASPKKDMWNGQVYVKVFRKLGFNVNPKFKKFDPNTQYPCMMRCVRNDIKEPYWYSWVYYDGFVYEGNNCGWSFDEFLRFMPNFRVTSMLQVWV
ncbi:hypothetical protein J3L18_31020 [Mucilaginibacter gossypii]|uniref:hypothetical protein n=1 Tax=Mucilaginibacter gossypii TaxID=551996 RepID=UPI000DCCAFF9|nr:MULTISPECIES: hypothetical protein [Mucilaginibacter]QTE37480.1 hypothetical protein J3L18_31020 [Mucilaginibacter gossypii]RAV52306.1 hypothetical protein DIU36_24535 [Mucilaginibacter rubeus]